MKKLLIYLMYAFLFCILPSPFAVCQTYDFASASYDIQTTDYQAIIRKVDASKAVVYYRTTANDGFIALIEYPTLNISRIKLKTNYYVHDMRVLDDNVYFCGEVGDGASAFIGHVYLSHFLAPNPRTVTYYVMDPDQTSTFTRMTAYKIAGHEKVVLVGHYDFIHDHDIYLCPDYPGHSCRRRYLAEADFNGWNLTGIAFAHSDDANHVECVVDVVETQSHLAAICNYTDRNAISIHLCSKNNVVFDFINNPYSYFTFLNEGLSSYRACLMNGDTIAVASLSAYYDPTEHFATTVRVFDLQSMQNIYAHRVETGIKKAPLDLLYMPADKRLVLLQEAFPNSYPVTKNLFINVEPFTTTPYSAKCWFDGLDWFYSSIDRLTPNEYLAAGGEYWCMRNAGLFTSPNNCYKPVDIQVKLPPIGIVDVTSYPFFPLSISYTQFTDYSNVPNDNISIQCIIP